MYFGPLYNIKGYTERSMIQLQYVDKVKLNKCILKTQGSTLTVARLPGASEMRLRASENGTQLAQWGK